MAGSNKIDDVSPTASVPEPEPEPDDLLTYVQQLADRTARAEAQLALYIEAHEAEAEVELAKTKERLEREAERELSRLRGQLALELLEVLDNFDRSLQSNSGYEAIRQGLIMVRKQFFAALEGMGISEVDAQDQPFDPNLHKAVATIAVSDPAQHGKVVAVLKAGYTLADHLVRPAAVQVGQKTASNRR